MRRVMAMATMLDEIKKSLAAFNGKWGERKGLCEFSAAIAERKAFLSKKKLTYYTRLRIDDAARTVRFSEMLVEAGSGLSSGGDFDSGISSGFGVKTESYNTFKGTHQGTIQEQSRLFGKDYSYQFDFNQIRSRVQGIAEKAGYKFDYQTLPVK
jgi:hypothetical protein